MCDPWSCDVKSWLYLHRDKERHGYICAWFPKITTVKKTQPAAGDRSTLNRRQLPGVERDKETAFFFHGYFTFSCKCVKNRLRDNQTNYDEILKTVKTLICV